MLLYFSLSITTSLVFFKLIRRITLNSKENSTFYNADTQRVDVPMAKLDPNFDHGTETSFTDRPFITKMECEGTSSYNRVCKFENICYSPNTDRFFALTVDKNGLKNSWMGPDDNRLLDLTTVDNHNIFYFEFDESPENALQEFEKYNMRYMLVSKKTFVFSRFVHNNIMHNIHDDFIGQYIMHKRFSVKSSDKESIDADNFIFFTDRMIENSNDHLLATLTRYPFIYREYLKLSKTSSPPICFENAIVGNSKDGTWYDYGFYDEPQGPISKMSLKGTFVQEAANYLKNYYHISVPSRLEINTILKKIAGRKDRDVQKISTCHFLSIFSRTKDRLILNEKELIAAMERTYGLPVKLVQLENLSFNEIIDIMSRTVISMGLHGSALVFTMFMPANSILLEMFPYGVPGENYSPFRTMSWLPDMQLTYKMWLNRNPTMNYAQLGIRKAIYNLTPEDFRNIISLKTVPPHVCCGNLPWHVRIYQDTVVDFDEIKLLIEQGIMETLSRASLPKDAIKEISELLEMSRNRVKYVDHKLYPQTSFSGSDKIEMFRLIISWVNPWNDLIQHPSLYGIWIEEMFEEITTKDTSLTIETCAKGSDVNAWIRPYRFDKRSGENIPAAVYSKKFTFKCE